MCINWKEGIQNRTQEPSLCDLGETEFGALLLARMVGERSDSGTQIQILSCETSWMFGTCFVAGIQCSSDRKHGMARSSDGNAGRM
jgi:hypothetical protein